MNSTWRPLDINVTSNKLSKVGSNNIMPSQIKFKLEIAIICNENISLRQRQYTSARPKHQALHVTEKMYHAHYEE